MVCSFDLSYAHVSTLAALCSFPYNIQVFYHCSSPAEKKEFLRAMHSILRDKHRRQLLKTESLPNSQQYVPFGGKRLCALKGARPAMNRAGNDNMAHHPSSKCLTAKTV